MTNTDADPALTDAPSLVDALRIAPYTTDTECTVCHAPDGYPCAYLSDRPEFPAGTPRPEPHYYGGRERIELSGLLLMEVLIETRRDAIEDTHINMLSLIDRERAMWAEFEEGK